MGILALSCILHLFGAFTDETSPSLENPSYNSCGPHKIPILDITVLFDLTSAFETLITYVSSLPSDGNLYSLNEGSARSVVNSDSIERMAREFIAISAKRAK